MPCLRQKSIAPSSASFRMLMILLLGEPCEEQANAKSRTFQGSRSPTINGALGSSAWKRQIPKSIEGSGMGRKRSTELERKTHKFSGQVDNYVCRPATQGRKTALGHHHRERSMQEPSEMDRCNGVRNTGACGGMAR